MMMRIAGGHGVVSPLDFQQRRKPLSPLMWAMIGASALVHVGAGVWLHQQRFELAEAPLRAGRAAAHHHRSDPSALAAQAAGATPGLARADAADPPADAGHAQRCRASGGPGRPRRQP